MVDVADIVGRFFKDQPPSWFIDVGVGCGKEAWVLKALWPRIKVVGLEPVQELLDAANAAGYPGDLWPWGAAGWPHEEIIHLDGERSSTFRVGEGPERRVILRPLDRFLSVENLKIDNAILWADVEGGELGVLRGAWQLLSEGRIKLVHLEVREKPLAPGACCLAELDSFLAAFRFARVLDYNQHRGDDPHHDSIWVQVHERRTW